MEYTSQSNIETIHITLDTCVWNALLLENYHREDNLFEELCYWIENRYLIHIVPDNIIAEWDRNKEKVKKLTVDFFNQQKLSIKKNSELSSTYDPSAIPNLVQKRMNRIDSILKTFSESAYLNDTILIDSAKRSLKTLAPNHIKDSLRDTVNILTIIDYLKKNVCRNSYFLTCNFTDFSTNKENRSILHEQLTELFSLVNLTYVYVAEGKDLGMPFFYDLRKNLPSFNDYLIDKRKSINYNEKPINEYLDTLKYIDMFLSKKEPKKIDKDLIKSIINRHDSYKSYFLKNVGNIYWFDFLKEEGYFSPELNPAPIENLNSASNTFWESLFFLEKVSAQIKKGNYKNFIPDILSIINEASTYPRNNEYTWYSFLNILINLPNGSIPKEFFNFIPVWLHGNDDTSLLSSNLCEKLLPKFLNDIQSKDNIEKAEIILEHLFAIEKKDIIKGGIYDSRNSSYKSRISLHFLLDVLVKKALTSKIAENCSDKIILNLGRNLKKLLIDYPYGLYLFINIDETDFELKIFIDDIHLIVKCLKYENEKSKNGVVILNYEELDDSQMKDKLIEALIEMDINYESSEQNEKNINNLILCLKNDLNFSFGFSTPIYKLDYTNLEDDKIIEVFSLIFREIINAKAKYNTNETLKILNTICYDKNYRLPFYKRITLYVIGQNWNELKSFFWKLVKDNDVEHFFSKHEYYKDLHHLLKMNQLNLNAKEKNMLLEIIVNGEQGNLDTNEEQNEYWQLSWFSALKEIEPFKEKYEFYSKKQNKTIEHFENLGELQYSSGSIPPVSLEEISTMKNIEIVEYLQLFRAKPDFGKPSINGLSEVFEKAIFENPQKYSEEIDLYRNIYYVYVFRMFYAFTKAWENNKQFNWDKVLLFCCDYIKSVNFYTDQLEIKDDGMNVTSDWVVGSIGNLLTSGLEDEKHSLDLELLPLVKEILKLIIPKLVNIDDSQRFKKDYISYLFNSTAGKVLRALLNYSLCVARNYYKKEDDLKWEPEIKSLFELSINKRIIDVFVLQGLYYRQFYYLSKSWIVKQIKINYQLDDKLWLAFMSGFVFANPPFNKGLFKAFYPHYLRAIDNDIQFKRFDNPGIIRHLIGFYFWGYEDLKSDSLIVKFLSRTQPENISEMIHFIWSQENYISNFKNKEKIKSEIKILDLWRYLSNKYGLTQIENEQKILGDLIKFIAFVPELNKEITFLVLKSSSQINKRFLTNDLIEFLNIQMSKGNPLQTATYIGIILNSISFNNYYFADREKEPLVNLVTFMYQNYQKEEADKFCNKLSLLEYDFLKELYYSNNPD